MHPLVEILNEESTATAANFRSLSGRKVDIWYDDGEGGTEQGHLSPGTTSTINTYEGHSFFVTPAGRKDHILNRFTISKEKVFYSIEDPESPGNEATVTQARREEAFIAEYFNRTGIPWRHYFSAEGQPRAPPSLFMWPVREIGDVHRVVSGQGYWKCDGPKAQCQDGAPVTLELEALSLQPKVFVIERFLSESECSSIIGFARPRLHHSQVGNADAGGILSSSTRTSSNTWIPRETSELYDSLYRRAADLLQLDQSILRSNLNAEDLQVVHYVNGQKYDAHSDWDNGGHPESRYITLLLYLTDIPVDNPYAGGETAFPKGAGGKGFKVRPQKGAAVLFYNLLEDGNGDDLSVHASLPTVEGEKWLANLWV